MRRERERECFRSIPVDRCCTPRGIFDTMAEYREKVTLWKISFCEFLFSSFFSLFMVRYTGGKIEFSGFEEERIFLVIEFLY